jgi:hypothetical protein
LHHPISAMPSDPTATDADIVLLRAARAKAGTVTEVADSTDLSRSSVHVMTTRGTGLSTARAWHRLLLRIGLDPAAILSPNADESVPSNGHATPGDTSDADRKSKVRLKLRRK